MIEKELHSHPASLSIEQFSYELPNERIARYPLEQRGTSKLLVYKEGKIDQQQFKDLPSLLQENDCLVFNDTKVVHARIHFQRQTGAQIEVFCLEPVEPAEVTAAFARRKTCKWRAMVGNSKKWKAGEILSKEIASSNGSYQLRAALCEKEEGAFIVQFSWEIDLSFAEVLHDAGVLPIPPYLDRDAEEEDEERYQTIYAQADGSVAAPTAGLHFTQGIFDELEQKQVRSLFVTLHVGAGTFKPVQTARMKDHVMHQERIRVTRSMLEDMLAAASKHRIIAVGTTSLRTIESIYWFGVQLIQKKDVQEFFIDQWAPYELDHASIGATSALEAVLSWMRKNEYSDLVGSTQVIIAPGYQIKMADTLITNFHQPNSTLLLLVAALIGDDWKEVYDYALDQDFRFLSFGDSSILFKS